MKMRSFEVTSNLFDSETCTKFRCALYISDDDAKKTGESFAFHTCACA